MFINLSYRRSYKIYASVQIFILHKNFPFSEETVENKNGHSKYLQKKNNIICGITIKKKVYIKLKIDTSYYLRLMYYCCSTSTKLWKFVFSIGLFQIFIIHIPNTFIKVILWNTNYQQGLSTRVGTTKLFRMPTCDMLVHMTI